MEKIMDNITIFENLLIDRIRQEFPDSEIQILDINKLNNKSRSITVKKPGFNISPAISINSYVQLLDIFCLTFEEGIEKFILSLHEAFDVAPDIPEIDKDFIIENCEFTIMNKEKNKELLEDAPYIALYDLALVPYIIMNDNKENYQTIKINYKLSDHYGIDVKVLFDACWNNMQPHIEDVSEVLKSLSNELGEACKFPHIEKFKLISNKNRIRGAACGFNFDNFKKLADEWMDDIVVFPASVHEVLLMPANGTDYRVYNEIVKAVNKENVSDNDFLSDHIYVYHRNLDLLTSEEQYE